MDRKINAIASWTAAEEATRMFLQAHLFQDFTWAMPGRDELGRRYGAVEARIVGVSPRHRVVVLRSLDPRDRDACFSWSFQSFEFEWREGRVSPMRLPAAA